MRDLEDRCLTRHDWHGDWNYCLLAVPRPAPGTAEARPGPALAQADLNQPALTGASPQAVTALAAALAGRPGARLEHDLRVRHGPLTRAHGAGGPRRLDTAGYLLAALLKRHLGVPSHVTAALLGVHDATVRHAVRRITAVLSDARSALPSPGRPPPARHVRTLGELRRYAAGHGITLIPAETDTPPPATLTAPGTPQIT